MKTYLFSLAISVLAIACSSGSNSTPSSLNPDGIAKDLELSEWNQALKQEEGFILLDVRTQGEIDQGHIPGAMHIDILEDGFEDKIKVLDQQTPVYVYCRSGGRSADAMEIMHEAGFKEVYNLLGGYTAWSQD